MIQPFPKIDKEGDFRDIRETYLPLSIPEHLKSSTHKLTFFLVLQNLDASLSI